MAQNLFLDFKYNVEYTKEFKKDYKKLNKEQKEILNEVISKLANKEVLEQKYKDHELKGGLNGIRDCHIEPDLVLIYKKSEEYLILTALRIGSHNNLGID